jgi:hypothetical protein
MLTLCNTIRGRVACGLGGVLVAALALACLWTFSPPVAAGDDPPPRTKDVKPVPCPEPWLPLAVSPPQKEKAAALDSEVPPLPAVSGTSTIPPPPAPSSGGAPAAPPAAVDPPPIPPTGPILPLSEVGSSRSTPPPASQPAAESQAIKQLVVQLSEIRADRAKLDERERQTIQTIKRKYQDQKRALEQTERELRQLGINCEETATDKATIPPPGIELKTTIPPPGIERR